MTKLLFTLCTFLLLVFGRAEVHAQGGIEELMTIKNDSLTYQFLSRFAPVVGRQPGNGTVTLVEDPVFNYTLTYVPDPDFVGTDALLLVSFPFGYSVSFTEIKIAVEEAIITANHDLAQSSDGEPVRVPVLANDFTNTGFLELSAVPVANGGTVAIEGEEVVFTPHPGFVGLADFNYVICTYGGTCDLGTVTVNVAPGPQTAISDTLRAFTKREQPQFLFAPAGSILTTEPIGGTLTEIDGVPAYQPAPDFVGDEFLTYRGSNGRTTTFHLTVLDLAEKQFTVEDRAYTAVDASVKFNVLPNDLYSVFADCVTFGAPRFGSLTETGVKGEIVYTPPPGWSGVDRITYSSKAPGCEGEAELQTALVVVSDFAPRSSELRLTAPAGSPLTVTYAVPGGDVTWGVERGPNLGTLLPDPVSGDLVYRPAPAANGQTDVFTLSYCLNPDVNGGCQFRTTVPVTVTLTSPVADACTDGADCVWPGDTNLDGFVDVGDLLPIGLAMGQSGTPRPSADVAGWSAQYSEDWGERIGDIDLKHVDANGDQVISHLDTQVILQNIGLGHRLRPEPQNLATFDVSLRTATPEVNPGDLIVFDIIGGSNVVIVEDVYGFIFPFDYDRDVVDPASVDVSGLEEGWLGYDSPIMVARNNDGDNGRLNVGVTRTGGTATSGFGKMGTLSVVIVEDVYGFYEDREIVTASPEVTTVIGGQTATVMDAAGHLNAVRVRPVTVKVTPAPDFDVTDFTPTEATDFLDEKLLAFPNPTGGNLTVHLNGQQRFSGLTLTDLTGRTLRQISGLDTNHRELNLSDLPNGIYTLTLTTQGGVVNRKIEILR